MVRSKMGLGAMFLLLVVSVLVLPVVLRRLNHIDPHFIISGFENQERNNDALQNNVPAIGRASQLPTWRPDANTNYLCRSPNENGSPCPEGSFCDGTTQSCIPMYVGGNVPTAGYFS